MTRRLYHQAALARDFDAVVLDRRAGEGGSWVVLDQTLFYPLSGGQLADQGTLGPARVLDVKEEADGSIWHLVQGDLPPGAVHGSVDWARRVDHMQQHTGQHLLSAALIELYQAPTLSFHMGEAASTIDVDQLPEREGGIAEVEDLCARVIAEHRPVRVHEVAPAELSNFRLRKAPQVEGPVRLIEIDGFDVSPCGGTHVANSAEIGAVRILRSERVKKALTRLTFLCGGRVHADHRRKVALLADLSSALSQTEENLAERVRALLAQVKDLAKQNELMRGEQLVRRAGDLARTAKPLPGAGRYVRHCEPMLGAAELAVLGRAIAAEGAVALLAGGEQHAHLFFAAPAGMNVSMRDLLALALPPLNGRGGGSPVQAQGGGPLVSGLPAALDAAEQGLLAALRGEKE